MKIQRLIRFIICFLLALSMTFVAVSANAGGKRSKIFVTFYSVDDKGQHLSGYKMNGQKALYYCNGISADDEVVRSTSNTTLCGGN